MPPQRNRERAADAAKLYLHIGMPKTGTTSFQHVLQDGREALEAIDYVYPDRWLKGSPGGHHVLTDSMTREPEQGQSISREVRGYLRGHPGKTVILSAEGLASTVLESDTRGTFVRFVERCGTVAETTVVLALRRLDEFLASAYLQVTKKGRGNGTLTPEQYLETRGNDWTDRLFSGVQAFREATTADLVLIPYHEGRDSLPELLRAVGIDGETALRSATGKRVNRRLGLKAQAVFLLPDEALEVLGIQRRRQLIDLFSSGRFEFRDEIYDYDVLGGELRREIQTRALKEARRCGIDEYADAFGEIEARSTPRARLESSLISAADLSDLARAVEAERRPANRPSSRGADGARPRRREPADLAQRPSESDRSAASASERR
jgi:hypothetical protein